MKKLLLLIDFSNLFHRGFHVHPSLEYKGVPTGGAYGFISQMAALVNSYHPTTIVVCDDFPPYFRSKVLPSYKQARKRIVDDDRAKAFSLNRQISIRFTEALGWPFLRWQGLEADDLLAALVKNYEAEYTSIGIVSADSDLWQLLDQDNLFVYTGMGKNKKELRKDQFLSTYPTLRCAKDWGIISAITGGHNGLPGVRMIGELKALRWYAQCRGEPLPDGKVLGKKDAVRLRGAEALINKSIWLVELPYPGIADWYKLRLPLTPLERYSSRSIISFLNSFGIKFSPSMAAAFDQ